MLELIVEGLEFFDETKDIFLQESDQTLKLEHSLLSISKWEAIWKKPYLPSIAVKEEKSKEEALSYIKCMCINQVNHNVFERLTRQNLNDISNYINDKRSATWFKDENKQKLNRQTLTSELIYYYMIAYDIPFECEKWHLNRLLTLIRICGIKQEEAERKQKKKKAPRAGLINQQRALNEQRKASLGTTG